MKQKTPAPLYRQGIPVEDRGETYISRYFKVDPLMSNHLGQPLHPLYYECNLRIDFAPDGGIYKVEWSNTGIDEAVEDDLSNVRWKANYRYDAKDKKNDRA